jgi:hypothetical protein
MPFKSSAQMRAAFSGALGPKMKSSAKTWAKETPDISSLPQHVKTAAKNEAYDKLRPGSTIPKD